MKFKDQIVVVTGSTRGIGKDIAQTFANNGATVIIIGRSQDDTNKVSDEIVKNGGQAEGFACDVTNFENTSEIITKILDKYKRVDILVNNAGITKDNLLLRMSVDDFNNVINVNLKGVFNCTKVIAKAMLRAKKGKIINISSVIGIMGNVGQANYAASKSGIIGFTKSVALELASRGITVNAIAPGYIKTDMTEQMKSDAKDDILRKIPVGEFGEASDVSNACVFLASKEANYITGQTIVVDGGMAI